MRKKHDEQCEATQYTECCDCRNRAEEIEQHILGIIEIKRLEPTTDLYDEFYTAINKVIKDNR